MDVQFSLNEIHRVALDFWKQLPGKKIIAFHGEMGAGKTTFIHALCDVLQVASTVGSPTFSLINEYHYEEGIMYHIDLYRLQNEEEALRAGVEDCIYSGNLCLIEWPGRVPSLLPGETIHVYLDLIDTNIRRLQIKDK